MTTGLHMLRAAELGLSIGDLDQITTGMLTDMCIERRNDSEEYAVIATQEDFDSF